MSGADIVMLDNMNPSTLKVTTTTIQDKNGGKNGGV
jgi:nicotinate-nucleotide pyrophosphorylase